ncbi:MAG: hypothetical protein DI535_04180 [Citrobacter freundii]|nr:MAG: hypothetical protein DI535_04180 [Citrobacter freundii]
MRKLTKNLQDHSAWDFALKKNNVQDTSEQISPILYSLLLYINQFYDRYVRREIFAVDRRFLSDHGFYIPGDFFLPILDA